MNREIAWNIVNSLLAGGLVFLGAFTDGNITTKGVIIATIVSLLAAINLFKEYWASKEKEYKVLFKFL